MYFIDRALLTFAKDKRDAYRTGLAEAQLKRRALFPESSSIAGLTAAQQIELLAQPVTKLTDAELALLRQPVVAVSDVNPASSSGTFAMAKNGPNKPPTGPTVQTTAPAVPALPLRHTAVSFDLRNQVVAMAKRGIAATDIARSSGLSEGEVEVVLGMVRIQR